MTAEWWSGLWTGIALSPFLYWLIDRVLPAVVALLPPVISGRR